MIKVARCEFFEHDGLLSRGAVKPRRQGSYVENAIVLSKMDEKSERSVNDEVIDQTGALVSDEASRANPQGQ